MPTYAYRCRDCGHQFDIFQKFSDASLTVCPTCEGTIRRVIQPTGVVFKGTGFYINDSRGKSTSESSSSDKDSTDDRKKDGTSKDGKADDAKAPAVAAEKSSGNDAKSASGKPEKTGDSSKASKPAAAAASSR